MITRDSSALQPRARFSLSQGDQTVTVADKRADVADRIDVNHDGVLSDSEIKAYLQKTDILKDPKIYKVDEQGIMGSFKAYLQDKRLASQDGYHTYQQISDELDGLQTQFPTLCQKVSLGKTAEGRDIWALKISKDVQGDTSKKPGVVFTGATHAREWMSMETPLRLAHTLVETYATDPRVQKDVDSAEVWVVPCVNPDGYEYSRTTDTWWRKNRAPVDDSVCSTTGGPASGGTGANITYGVDVNRNYDDGNPAHATVYRPVGDAPCRTDDDIGETSDDPNSDTFRGLKGGSELETQAMLGLELGVPNIMGVIDHHGYGEMLLRPWGGTQTPPDRVAEYDDVGNKMNAAMSHPFTYEPAIDLYPTSGTSTDVLHANGITAFTIELGTSFQPPVSTIPTTTADVNQADLTFLDWIVQNKTGVVRQPLGQVPALAASGTPSPAHAWD